MKFIPFATAAKHKPNLKGQREQVIATADWYWQQPDGAHIRVILHDVETVGPEEYGLLFMSEREAGQLSDDIREQLECAERKVEMEKWVVE